MISTCNLLQELFRQFQLGGDGVLPPDALRKALASTFSSQQRLQLGGMDDAAECFVSTDTSKYPTSKA